MPESDLVFISANSADFALAEQVYDFLTARGVPAFLSSRSLPELGDSDYRRAIDAQLDICAHMVVVASARDHVRSPWVEAEWGFFVNAKRSRNKTGNIVTVTAGDLKPGELPPSLRYYEVVPLRPENLPLLLKYVAGEDSAPAPAEGVACAAPSAAEPGGPGAAALAPASGRPLSVAPSDSPPAEAERYGPRIKLFGIGGAGGSVLELMIAGKDRRLPTVLVTSDRQVAERSRADIVLLVGEELTAGLGSGSDPRRGREAAEADAGLLRAELSDCDLAFLSAGLGGGVGSGATPVVARLARELDVVTVCFVSLPFGFEGPVRARQARAALAELRELCDMVIPLPCDLALQNLAPEASLQDAFGRLSRLHEHWIDAIGSLPQAEGLVNLDFADLRAVFKGAGVAALGEGAARGPGRVAAAVEQAARTGYLSDLELRRAGAVFLLIESGPGLGLADLNAATETLLGFCNRDVDLVFGHRVIESLDETLRAIIVATRFEPE